MTCALFIMRPSAVAGGLLTCKGSSTQSLRPAQPAGGAA